MIDSRDLDMLEAPVKLRAELFLKACKDKGIDVVINSTYRDYEFQEILYSYGRTDLSKGKVTNAKPGQSFHNFRCAFDFFPKVNGKAAWDNLELFRQCGEIAKSVGLEWAGDWEHFKEYAHCQWTGGLTLAQLQAGERVGGCPVEVPIQVA